MSQNCNWQAAQELFLKDNYSLAQSYFTSMSSCNNLTEKQKEKALFQSGVCAMELFNSDAEYQLEKYIIHYPNGLFVDQAIFRLGNIFFRNKEYVKAIAKYNQINLGSLVRDDYIMLHFRLGYSHFIQLDFEEAKIIFEELKGVQFKYKDLTTYYVAHIAYIEGNYATAYTGFNSLLDVAGLGLMSRYYIAQIYYLQERYDDLVIFSETFTDSLNTKRSAEIARLVGDSYYQTNRFEKALPYLEKHQSSFKSSLNRLDKYQLAYTYYQLENFEKAQSLFKDLLQKSDSLAQYAAYHLADCYLKNNKKVYALNAYKHAASFNFDYTLQEDAAFNHAKLVYENVTSYTDAVTVFNEFLQNFPNSINISFIQDYLINAYSLSKNYKEGLSELDKLEVLTFEQQEAYQRMAYFRAIELFNDDLLELAFQYFNKSLQHPISEQYKALCYYWKGEAYYILGQFSESIQEYEKFIYSPGSLYLPEYINVYYSLGYANHNKQEYSKSIKWFRKYINNVNIDRKKLNDSYLRIADAYFMTNKYARANDYYSKSESLDLFDVDYSIYQQAQCFGLNGSLLEKEKSLKKLIQKYPSSHYSADAKFDLANIYLTRNLHLDALDIFEDIISNHPYSYLVKSSLLKSALSYYNLDQYDEAIAHFEQVIKDFPSTNEAAEALVGLKNIYIDKGDVNIYFDYITTLSDVSVSAGAQDTITYQAAEMLYAKNENEKALSAFEEYIQKFPLGVFRIPAHFYKADLLFQFDKKEALKEYLLVLEFNYNQFTERSLSQAARIEFTNNNFLVAARYYDELLHKSQDKELHREAIIHLFYCYKELNKTEEMIKSAQQMLALEKLSEKLAINARLELANAAFYSSEYHLAAKYYNNIIESTFTDAGAEAKYQISYILFLQEKYAEVEESIFELAENFTADYFIAKGFVLLADVYVMQKNYFQAKATLESVIENHDGDELSALAKENLEMILNIEKEQNQAIKEEEVIIDLLADMDIDYDYLTEEIEIIDEE